KILDADQIASISLLPVTADTVPAGMPVVWASGEADIGIALMGSHDRLVDTSLVATLDGSVSRAWDTLVMPSASAGSYALSVTAGNLAPTALTVDVVDAPDALAPVDPHATVAAGDD